jgi:hypothetical protein
MKPTMRLKACRPASSFHRPGQPGVMRALGRRTLVISTISQRGAAHRPRAQVHQVVSRCTTPSTALNTCAMGETTMRFFSVRPRSV